MGTYWNKGAYMVGQSYNEPHEGVIVYFRTLEIVPEVRTRGLSDALSGDYPEAKVTAIWRGSLQSAEDFEKVIRQARPVVLEKADLGPCVSKWDLDYVVEKVGPERKVSIRPCS
jgi:tRNA wybutosine-synthesizing protein 4